MKTAPITQILSEGDTLTFRFGSPGEREPENPVFPVSSATLYSPLSGFGWEAREKVRLFDGPGYVAGTNARRESRDREGNLTRVEWEYPSFTLDVPPGVYEVRLLQVTDGRQRAVNGACLQGNLYAVRWFEGGIPTSYAEPLEKDWVWTQAGGTRESLCLTAVPKGRLKIQLTTWLKDSGESGVFYLREISVTRKEQISQPSPRPTLRFIGDSTLAKYPPQDGGPWAPIPERTGWGEDFSMGKFTDRELMLDNSAVAGSSLKSYLYEGFFNDFFLRSHPGDAVIIESGINDNAPGRRFSDAGEFEERLRYLLECCQAFGLKVVLSSGTGSAPEYVERIAALAEEYRLPYVELLRLWQEYLKARSPLDLTVDGVHLKRVGGIVAAQLVANAIAGLEGYSFSGHILRLPVCDQPPGVRPEGLRIAARTRDSVTVSWEIHEDSLYLPENLITCFRIFRKDSPEAAPVLTASPTAYVSAGMTGPKMRATLEASGDKACQYFVACGGVNGDGPLSEPVDVPVFAPDDAYLLRELTEKLHSSYYPEHAFAPASWEALAKALGEAESALGCQADRSHISAALHALEAAVSSLKPQARFLVREDFGREPLKTAPWGVTGKNRDLLSCRMDEKGRRSLRLYVEASGERFVRKEFPQAPEIDPRCMTVAFEWHPGIPDKRNCTEIEFYGGDDRLFSMKTSCNGHIGFVTGNYDETDTAYLTGDGFHEYEGTRAVDLGLSGEGRYQVEIALHFKRRTADLRVKTIQPGPGPEDQKELSFRGIPLEETSVHSVTAMNFLLKRGKLDNGVTNDLSLLWDTEIGNFVIYYS